MNPERYLDYFITALLIIVVVALVFVSSKKVKEDFTELYFDEHLNLPKYTNGYGEFTFAVHNMENKQYNYDVTVAAELYNDTNATEPFNILDIAKFDAVLADNETRIFNENFSIPRAEKAKIRVLIKNYTQDIHFWTFYAREFQKYEGIGYGMLDCLKTVQANPFSQIQVLARGSYAAGWPKMQFWFDGKMIKEQEVATDKAGAYFFDVLGEKGTHVIDTTFTNDFSNKTAGDRNLYIEKIKLNEQEINKESFTKDSGSKEKAFDCQGRANDGNLYSTGAVRVKVNVN